MEKKRKKRKWVKNKNWSKKRKIGRKSEIVIERRGKYRREKEKESKGEK